jgi:acetyl-CoA acetyltransferase
MFEPKNAVAIVGVGHSAIGRRQPRPLGLLAMDAAKAALADAGLTADQVDGAGTFPVYPGGNEFPRDGRTHVSVRWMVNSMALGNVRWWVETQGGNISTAIEQAAMALAHGRCRYALVWRALHMPAQGSYQPSYEGTASIGGDLAFSLPYGLSGAPMGFALSYMRYMKLYGARREHMAALALACRRGANKNPHAYFRDTPLSFEDYMNARMISDPLTLLDCDIPVDGAGAVVLARADRAASLPNRPAYITGLGQAGFAGNRPPISIGTLGADLFEECRNTAASIGRSLWETSHLKPTDVDAAMLYDGFSPDVYFWLEGLGFCKEGEAFEFIQDGRVEIGGEFPVNTFGGNLSEGRLHGIGHWIEATLQVQGRAGARQIPKAENIAVATGMLNNGSGAIISRDRSEG